MQLGRVRVRGFWFCALGFEVLRLLRARVRGFVSFARQGLWFCALGALGFEVLRLLRARVRGFASFAR